MASNDTPVIPRFFVSHTEPTNPAINDIWIKVKQILKFNIMENLKMKEILRVIIKRNSDKTESINLHGRYSVKCFDNNQNLKWEDTIDNIITDLGVNQILDSAFGTGPIAGPFLGLISSVGYSIAPAVGNTMATHTGWNEAGNGVNYPNWSTPASNARVSISFSPASARSKAFASAATFIIAANGGTVKGCFIVFGSGASAVNANTGGVLFSAGLFVGGDKTLSIGDTLQVTTYTLSA